MKRWIVPKFSREIVNNLAEECNIDPFLSLLAVSRGYTDPIDLEAFLSCDDVIDSPFELIDMAKAADTVNNAINNGELIAIYGDYDCDGVTATALLKSYLDSCGARSVCYIPNRINEGYGMNRTAVDKLENMGVNLIVTVDNGINSVDEIDYANSLGIDVVVTDHHMPAGKLPNAKAVVNPHRADCPSEFKDLAGVGVAFKLVCALSGAEPEELLPQYGDLVALGTVADVMPLVSENRVLVREGISYINGGGRAGLSALINIAGYSDKVITSNNVAFSLCPRINAAGRIGDAMRAVKLLLTTDEAEAAVIANEINSDNTERQKIEGDIEAEALKIIERDGLMYDRVIVVSGKDWHRGIVGIVAAKILEKYGKPTLVLSEADGIAVGSGRSIEGFSLFDAIVFASQSLIKFGGHDLAAGVTLNVTDIDEFRNKLNEYARKQPLCMQSVKLDCKLNPAALSVEMGELTECLEPFGCGNPTPLFGIYSLKISRISAIGNGKHLRLVLSRDSSVIAALRFGISPENFPFDVGDTVDIAVNLGVNEFRGERQLSVIIKEIRPSGESEAGAESLALYDDFKRGLNKNYLELLPTRDEIGAVYRKTAVSISYKKLVNKLCDTILAGKIAVACDVLCELGLVSEETVDGERIITAIPGVRSDLGNSEILNNLKGGE